MTIYTSRLIVIPNYGNRLRLNSSSNSSSYSYQHEKFRSTLIVLPYSNRKRFIQGIEVRCGSFNNHHQNYSNNNNKRFQSISPIGTSSDIFSPDESICEYYPTGKPPITGESYFDVRHRLLAKSNLFAYTLKDDTDGDENDSFCCSSMGYSHHNENYYKK
jgi:hypothetical protein